MHKHTALSNLADLEKLVESRLKSIKPNTTPGTVFKKPFGIHLRDKAKDAGALAKGDRIDIELKLKLMAGLVDELRAKNAESILNIALNKKVSRIYKIKQAVSVFLGVASTGAAVASLAAPGAQAYSIIRIVRSGAMLAKDIGGLFVSVEKKVKVLEGYLAVLDKMFTDASGKAKKMNKKQKAAELTLATMNAVLGIKVLPTVKKAKTDLKPIKGHVATMVVKSQDLQKEVQKILDENTKLIGMLENAVGKKQVKKAFKDIVKSETTLNKILDCTHDLVRRVNEVGDKVAQLESGVKKLNDPGIGIKAAQGTLKILGMTSKGIFGLIDSQSVEESLSELEVDYSKAGKKLEQLT
ncbi:MAG: hypothetical protein L3J36_03460 [Rhodobacteraceae bacterium]|nr:hypothetical protein [Paracoccaceae bacterium]